MHIDQMGSGGNADNARGGGTIVISGKSAILSGEIISNGNPFSTRVVESGYHAGSGGYIYISCSDKPCLISGDVSANGGAGSDDQKSNGGSGGRIVFNNTQVDSNKYSAFGGCSNIPTASSFNGAAGSVYFTAKKDLIYKHTNKCQAGMKSILNPNDVKDENITSLKVYNQTILSFSSSSISKDTMEVFINSLQVISATLSSPLQKDNKDLGLITLNIAHDFIVQNGTILNLAVEVFLNADSFKIDSNSAIKYHTSLVMNLTSSFNISGLVQQNDPTMGGDSNPTVIIYAGNSTKTDSFLESSNNQLFVIDNKAIIRAFDIMIFSDQNLTILGSLENVVENEDGQFDIVGDWLYGKL